MPDQPEEVDHGPNVAIVLIMIVLGIIVGSLINENRNLEEFENSGYIAAATSVVLTQTPTTTPTLTPTSVALSRQESLERDMVWLVNKLRREQGLNELVVDPALTEVAVFRSEDMAAQNYFGHTPPNGCHAWCLMDNWGIYYSWSGENIAWNNYSKTQTVSVSMNALVASPEHYKNLTNCHYELIGIGTVQVGSVYFYTQIFNGAREC